MPKGYLYILKCSDGSYYTGSALDIEQRLIQHQEGKGANYTKKRLPIELVFLEEFQRIDDAFFREKQIQGWNRLKKEALIQKNFRDLKLLSECKNDSHYKLWLRLRSATKTENKILKSFYSHGKLLLTGEYVVLDGAMALAVPTLYGQSLNIEKGSHNKLRWISLDDQNQVWFETEYKLSNNEILNQAHNDNPISRRLLQILKAAKELNSRFLSDDEGYTITTTLDFPKNWGLGTSSTLISNIANWANIDPYKLLEMTFGGSGYDIACAQATRSLSYQLNNAKQPIIQDVSFNPAFKQHLYFVHLNKKQNSREGIAQYRANTYDISSSITKINAITNKMIICETLEQFQELMDTHEKLISDIIQQSPVKQRLFNDFKGSIKSLGAWGGDFIMVASEANPAAYFQAKGYSTILSYSEMVKN